MGRPREFDYDAVILKVTKLFWKKGFRATSLSDLTRVTGLNKESLYSSFGNKEAIFRLALGRYIGNGPFEKLAVNGTHQADPIEMLVLLYRKLISDSQMKRLGKRGCLAFNSGLEFSNQSTRLSKFVMKEVDRLESFFRDLLKLARKEKLLPRGLNIRKAAFRAFAAAFTIREMAKFKSDRKLLAEIANSALIYLGTNRRV